MVKWLLNNPVQDPGLSFYSWNNQFMTRVKSSFSNTVCPTNKEGMGYFFQLMFDEYFNPPPSVASPVHAVVAPKPADSTGTPSSTTIDQDAPSISTSQTPQETQSLIIPSEVEEHFHD
ncbi:hypothetical protein Tco_1545868, partial [Tanacetum coccineum]